MTRLLQNHFSYVVDFEREDASYWTLLVIDDLFNLVRQFVENPPDGLDPAETAPPPVLAYCENYKEAEKRWVEFEPKVLRFEPHNARAVVMLPSVSHTIDEIGAVVFAPFAPATKPAELLEFLEKHDVSTRKLAALMDIEDTDDAEDGPTGLERTWKPLLATGRLSPHAVAIFSRAEYNTVFGDLPPSVARIDKHVANGWDGSLRFAAHLRSWVASLEGKFLDANRRFGDLTNHGALYDDCHDPSSVITVEGDKVPTLIAALQEFDPYGVWQWCAPREHAEVNGRPVAAPDEGFGARHSVFARQWLAAKSFVKSSATSAKPNVTALIALIEGVKLQRRPAYAVRQPLKSVPDAKIDDMAALGGFELARGGEFEPFASALRTWLVHPEQFVTDRTNRQIELVEIKIGGARNRKRVRIMMTYDGVLPASLTRQRTGKESVLPGRTALALERLAWFAHKVSWSVKEGSDKSDAEDRRSVLTLEFKYVEPTSLDLAPAE